MSLYLDGAAWILLQLLSRWLHMLLVAVLLMHLVVGGGDRMMQEMSLLLL